MNLTLPHWVNLERKARAHPERGTDASLGMAVKDHSGLAHTRLVMRHHKHTSLRYSSVWAARNMKVSSLMSTLGSEWSVQATKRSTLLVSIGYKMYSREGLRLGAHILLPNLALNVEPSLTIVLSIKPVVAAVRETTEAEPIDDDKVLSVAALQLVDMLTTVPTTIRDVLVHETHYTSANASRLLVPLAHLPGTTPHHQ